MTASGPGGVELPFTCRPLLWVYLIWLPASCYACVASWLLDLGEPLLILTGPLTFLVYMFLTARITVTAGEVVILNAFREVSIPTQHITEMTGYASEDGTTEPDTVVTAYGRFESGRLTRGRDPGNRTNSEVQAAVHYARDHADLGVERPRARWRVRRVRGTQWLVLVLACVSVVGQLSGG